MKGIVKHKRSRMVWDDITKDWVPRFGRGSIKKIEEDSNWIREAPADGCMWLTEFSFFFVTHSKIFPHFLFSSLFSSFIFIPSFLPPFITFYLLKIQYHANLSSLLFTITSMQSLCFYRWLFNYLTSLPPFSPILKRCFFYQSQHTTVIIHTYILTFHILSSHSWSIWDRTERQKETNRGSTQTPKEEWIQSKQIHNPWHRHIWRRWLADVPCCQTRTWWFRKGREEDRWHLHEIFDVRTVCKAQKGAQRNTRFAARLDRIDGKVRPPTSRLYAKAKVAARLERCWRCLRQNGSRSQQRLAHRWTHREEAG